MTLAMLTLGRGPVSAWKLIDVLWCDPPDNERNALQRHVSRLRATFADHGVVDAIRCVGGAYELDRDLFTLDLDHLEQAPGGELTALPYPPRWWLEPLAGLDHVDFIADRRRLEQLCQAERDHQALLQRKTYQRRLGAAPVPAEVIGALQGLVDKGVAGARRTRVIEAWLATVDRQPLAAAS